MPNNERDMNKFEASIKKAEKAAESLTKKLQKLALEPDKVTAGFKNTLGAVSLVAEVAEQMVENSKKYGSISQNALGSLKSMGKHAAVILKLTKKESTFNQLRVKYGSMTWRFQKRFLGAKSKELDLAYAAAEEEMKMLSIKGEISKLAEKAGGALKAQITKYLSISAIFGALVKIATGFAALIDNLGASFGVVGTKSGGIKDSLLEGHVEAIGIGKSMDDLIPIVNTLSSEFGLSLQASADMANAILDSSMAMGLSADEGAKLYGTLMSVGKLSQEQAENLAEGTYQLAEAEGVAPQAVMKDIAENTEIFAKFSSGGGKNIAEAAVQAKKLGIGLSDVAGIAEGLLDFQSSLSAEMEASMMIGRQINLQKARELALNNDLTGMMDEVLKQLGGEAAWNKLNMLQRQSMAKSLNTDVATMSKLVGEHGKIGKQKSFSDLAGKDTMSSLSRALALFTSIGAEVMKIVGPAIEGVANNVKDWLESGGLQKIKEIMSTIAEGAVVLLDKFAEWLTPADDQSKGLLATLTSVGEVFLLVGEGIGFVTNHMPALIAAFISFKSAAWAASIASSAAWATKSGAMSLGVGALVALAAIAAVYATVSAFSSDEPQVSSAQKGANFFTKGPQNLLVGDNPGGVEHVRVDPISSAAAGTAAVSDPAGPTQTTPEEISTGAYDIKILNTLNKMTKAIGDEINNEGLIKKVDTLVTNMNRYFGFDGLMYKKGIVVKDKEY